MEIIFSQIVKLNFKFLYFIWERERERLEGYYKRLNKYWISKQILSLSLPLIPGIDYGKLCKILTQLSILSFHSILPLSLSPSFIHCLPLGSERFKIKRRFQNWRIELLSGNRIKEIERERTRKREREGEREKRRNAKNIG